MFEKGKKKLIRTPILLLNWSFFFFFWCLIFNQNQSEVPSENTFENLLNRYTNTVQQFINRWLNNNKYRYIWWLTKWVIQGFCFFFFLANKLWSDTIWSDSLLNLSETNYSSCLRKKKFFFSRLNQKKIYTFGYLEIIWTTLKITCTIQLTYWPKI